MPRVAKAKTASAKKDSTANLGFEAKLWLATTPFGDNFISGQDEREQQQRPFRVGKRNPRGNWGCKSQNKTTPPPAASPS